MNTRQAAKLIREIQELRIMLKSELGALAIAMSRVNS